MAVHIVKSARSESHRRGGAQRLKNSLVPGMKINRLTGMAVGQHNAKTGGCILNGFHREPGSLAEQVIHQVGQVNDRFPAKDICFANNLAGVLAPDGQSGLDHPGHKKGSRTSPGRRGIHHVVAVHPPFIKEGQHTRSPSPAHRSAFHNQGAFPN